MAVAFNKFNVFATNLVNKGIDLLGNATSSADTLQVYLSNTAPNSASSTQAVKTDLAEITIQNGYNGPVSTINNGTADGAGTVTIQGTSFRVTATTSTSTAGAGPFRYAVLYDVTASSSLVGWWDYGSSITLQAAETFDVLFNAAAVGSTGNIFTVA